MKHCTAMARAGAATEARRERGGAAAAVPRDGGRATPGQVQGARARRAPPRCATAAHGSSALQLLLWFFYLALKLRPRLPGLFTLFSPEDTKYVLQRPHPGRTCAAGGVTVSARARRRPARRTPSSAWCRRTRTCCALCDGSPHAHDDRLEVSMCGIVLLARSERGSCHGEMQRGFCVLLTARLVYCSCYQDVVWSFCCCPSWSCSLQLAMKHKFGDRVVSMCRAHLTTCNVCG